MTHKLIRKISTSHTQTYIQHLFTTSNTCQPAKKLDVQHFPRPTRRWRPWPWLRPTSRRRAAPWPGSASGPWCLARIHSGEMAETRIPTKHPSKSLQIHPMGILRGKIPHFMDQLHNLDVFQLSFGMRTEQGYEIRAIPALICDGSGFLSMEKGGA